MCASKMVIIFYALAHALIRQIHFKTGEKVGEWYDEYHSLCQILCNCKLNM